MSDPSDPLPGDVTEYLGAPFPDPRDDEMDAHVVHLRRAGAQEMSKAAASAARGSSRLLTTYARRTVDRAVGTNNPALLVSGCVAVGIALAADNLYDASIFMARMVVAARGMGSTSQAVVGEAVADLPDGAGRTFLMTWLDPDPATIAVEDGPGFDPSDPAPDRFRAYGAAPFPDPLDAELDGYIAHLRRAGAAQVSRASAGASQRGCRVLLAYAERTAIRAVRAHDPSLLIAGYVALVMATANEDLRDVLMVMAPLHDAAQRSGSSPRAVIHEAAGLVDEAGRAFLWQWLARPRRHQSLKAMAYEVVEAADGLRYRRTW